VWTLLDRLGRPALAPHLLGRALALNQRTPEWVRDGGEPDAAGAAALLATITAGSACCHTLAAALPPQRRQRVRRGLRRQQRLLRPWRTVSARVVAHHGLAGLRPHARKGGEQRCLERLGQSLEQQEPKAVSPRRWRQLEAILVRQRRWLDELAQNLPIPEDVVRQSIVRLHRKGNKALRSAPASPRARRRLSQLVWIEELMDAGPGPMGHGRFPASPHGRLLLGLEEDRWLSGLVRAGLVSVGLGEKDSKRLARVVGRRRRELAANIRLLLAAVVAEDEVFARRLPWLIFCRLAEHPVPLTTAALAGRPGKVELGEGAKI
jgi:hypothetical protein